MGAFDSMGAGAAAGDKQQADIAQENRRIQIEAAKADEERRKNWNAEVESKKAVDWTKKQADIKRTDELNQKAFNNAEVVAKYNDQKEKDKIDRERQAILDARGTTTFNRDSEWTAQLRERELRQKDEAIAKARLEQEKYMMAFQEEKTQAENRKQALQTGIGSVLSTMEMNGGVIPVSAIKIFNQQHGKEGLELTGGFMSTDGSGGAVVQFKGPDGKPVDNFIPSDKISTIREQLFGKSSSGTRPSSSGAYAKEALGLKQESVEVRALQGTLGSISRQMEKIQIALNDPLLSEDQKKSLKEQYEDREMAYEHYNSQLSERVGVVPYAKKAAAVTADPAKEKVARPFEKLNGEKPASAAQAPLETTFKADPSKKVEQAGMVRMILPNGTIVDIPEANVDAAKSRGAKLAQ